MKHLFTLLAASLIGTAAAQTTIANGGFENWGNPSPGNANEPTSWYSNKSGSSIASAGPQTCFKDNSIVHTGTASARVETLNYIGTAVNGALVTGVVNAPTFTKSDGYIGTVKYNASTDVRRMAFTGRPDSLVGWYQYTSGGSGEQAKIRAVLHTADYFDPETPLTYHAACTANKIGDALFLGSTTNVTTWRRFSVPFNYTSSATPAYIMINATSSANQNTTITGSKFWLDDIAVIYNSVIVSQLNKDANIRVYQHDKNMYVDFSNRNEENAVLTIFDLTGKTVSSFNVEAAKLNSFGISDLNTGLYLYEVRGADFKKTGKFIVE